MRVAIMMRAIDQDSGHGAYTGGLVRSLLNRDTSNSYLLLYRSTKRLGCFASSTNAREFLVRAPHKLAWDQVAVPYVAWREGADIIFNPKFSIPLITHCPVAMGLQEPAWWVWPQHYERLDVLYIKTMLPLYCRKSAHIFPMSSFDLDESRRYLSLPDEKVTVAYAAHRDYFRKIEDTETLENFRREYQLPPRFILCVARVEHVGLDNPHSYHPGKNLDTCIRAFVSCRDRIPHALVVSGRRVKDYLLDTGWKPEDLRRIHFTDFIPRHEDMALLYNLADLFVMPSFYEGFAIKLVEAMACGCAAIASKTGAVPEISDGAALLADPYDPADFAAKIMQVLSDEPLRQELKAKSLQRAAAFSLDRTAEIVLDKLTQVVSRQFRRKRLLSPA
jgi:glycosyltransferase involved in cell wall biosynthesis